MGKRKNNGVKGEDPVDPKPYITEKYKVDIDKILKDFMSSEKLSISFDSSLSKTERIHLHLLSKKLGLESRSRGKGSDRFITLSRKPKLANVWKFDLNSSSRDILESYFARFPVGKKEEKSVLEPSCLSSQKYVKEEIEQNIDNLNSVDVLHEEPEIPRRSYPPFSGASNAQKKLPVFSYRSEILDTINACDVTIICAATGAGKSTQIPQFLLQDTGNNILCTQPRRISALSLASRVASETGTKLGSTVGYSIQLERNFSEETRLLFCTTGVLLRRLAHTATIDGNTATHIIVDEVHERTMDNDLLLLILREALLNKKRSPNKEKSIKVILMSASISAQTFLTYFRKTELALKCKTVEIPGTLFNVHKLFLEDILARTAFLNKQGAKYPSILEALEVEAAEMSAPENMNSSQKLNMDDDVLSTTSVDHIRCVKCGQSFDTSDDFGVHSVYCVQTKGDFPEVDIGGEKIEEKMPGSLSKEFFNGIDSNEENGSPNDCLLDVYEHYRKLNNMIDGSYADIDLILATLEYIELFRDDLESVAKNRVSARGSRKKPKVPGAVLIFLPGADDIAKLVEKLECDEKFGQKQLYAIFPLHSGISLEKQAAIFKSVGSRRKIVCATDIAETSITIDDVLYVIDVGLSKRKYFDPYSCVSMFSPEYIAKANALQRAGRAGRCNTGICFRLYSRKRFYGMLDEELPEVLRSPLEQLCLRVVSFLANDNFSKWVKLQGSNSVDTRTSVHRFLSFLVSPPDLKFVYRGMLSLYEIGAIDVNEELTRLGRALSRLPLHPAVGKMLLFSSVIGSQDIAVLLASFLSTNRDPFRLALTQSEKLQKKEAISALSGEENSDYLTYLLAFVEWSKDPTGSCSRYGLSKSVLIDVASVAEKISSELSPGFFTRRKGLLDPFVGFPVEVEILSCIATFPNLAIGKSPSKKGFISGSEDKIRPHLSSVVDVRNLTSVRREAMCLVFSEITRGRSSCSIRGCTSVSLFCVLIFRGAFLLQNESDDLSDNDDDLIVKLDEWISFHFDDLDLVIKLGVFRRRLENIFINSWNENKKLSPQQLNVIHTFLLICSEERAYC